MHTEEREREGERQNNAIMMARGSKSKQYIISPFVPLHTRSLQRQTTKTRGRRNGHKKREKRQHWGRERERERDRKDPVTLLSFAALLELPFFASLLQREKGKEKRKEERGKEGS